MHICWSSLIIKELNSPAQMPHRIEMANGAKPRNAFLAGVNPNAQGQRVVDFIFKSLVGVKDKVALVHVVDYLPGLPPASGTDKKKAKEQERAWWASHNRQLSNEVAHLLTPHKRLCRKKSIEVEVRIIRGKRVERTLLQEMGAVGASVLVVGASLHKMDSRRNLTIGALCCRNSPPGTAVLVISGDQVVMHSNRLQKSLSDTAVILPASRQHPNLPSSLLSSFQLQSPIPPSVSSNSTISTIISQSSLSSTPYTSSTFSSSSPLNILRVLRGGGSKAITAVSNNSNPRFQNGSSGMDSFHSSQSSGFFRVLRRDRISRRFCHDSTASDQARVDFFLGVAERPTLFQDTIVEESDTEVTQKAPRTPQVAEGGKSSLQPSYTRGAGKQQSQLSATGVHPHGHEPGAGERFRGPLLDAANINGDEVRVEEVDERDEDEDDVSEIVQLDFQRDAQEAVGKSHDDMVVHRRTRIRKNPFFELSQKALEKDYGGADFRASSNPMQAQSLSKAVREHDEPCPTLHSGRSFRSGKVSPGSILGPGKPSFGTTLEHSAQDSENNKDLSTDFVGVPGMVSNGQKLVTPKSSRISPRLLADNNGKAESSKLHAASCLSASLPLARVPRGRGKWAEKLLALEDLLELGESWRQKKQQEVELELEEEEGIGIGKNSIRKDSELNLEIWETHNDEEESLMSMAMTRTTTTASTVTTTSGRGDGGGGSNGESGGGAQVEGIGLNSKSPVAATFFSFEEMEYVTNGFAKSNLIGRGGYANVYKGMLPGGRRVAVKELFRSTEEAEMEFLMEVGIVCHVRHPCVTQLVGYCVDGGHRLLVYDLMANGSLERNLHSKTRAALSWERRVRASVDAAKGLEYLHHECPRRIVHRDVKTGNILIGANWEAQIADFGLARWLPKSMEGASLSPVEGTFGYMAPEYFLHGQLNEKTDAYSFGVVLLETITGRRPVDLRKPQAEENLVCWALPIVRSGQVEKLVDVRLGKSFEISSLRRMAAAAAMCLRKDPQLRPMLGHVARFLADDTFPQSVLDEQWMAICDRGVFENESPFLEREGFMKQHQLALAAGVSSEMTRSS